MSTSCICLRLILALSLVLIGLPLGAAEGPAAPIDQTRGAAGPIWLAGGLKAPAAPESASRSMPEAYSAVAPWGVGIAAGTEAGSVLAGGAATLAASTPLYLAHCSFLC